MINQTQIKAEPMIIRQLKEAIYNVSYIKRFFSVIKIWHKLRFGVRVGLLWISSPKDGSGEVILWDFAEETIRLAMRRAIGGWFSMPCLKSRKSNDRNVPEKSPRKRNSASKSGAGKRNRGNNVATGGEHHGHNNSATATHSTATCNDAVGMAALVVAASHVSEFGGSACGGSSHGGDGGGG
ncbi:OLC1v1006087C1 [Oldenlandia corymbosa var. corymbosa]|uniref:OLC1v1006087C1 n=1 Tax=Oldenlandia corymbosa var. corymbosa TaxID=529605 RepID=A0AAV1DGN2_OLDCO|nr:OLC1v1006087C1 [Oldenlandia corymbosa var. corymbosa]